MWLKLAADLVLIIHLAFVAFVVLGGLLVLRWPRLAVVHLPAVLWGIGLEFFAWICPLTPLEQTLRRAAGEQGYSGGFIEHYILPVLYPPGLTMEVQWLLGALVLAINTLFYGVLIKRLRRRGDTRPRA
jgi:hypothetical protein